MPRTRRILLCLALAAAFTAAVTAAAWVAGAENARWQIWGSTGLPKLDRLASAAGPAHAFEMHRYWKVRELPPDVDVNWLIPPPGPPRNSVYVARQAPRAIRPPAQLPHLVRDRLDAIGDAAWIEDSSRHPGWPWALSTPAQAEYIAGGLPCVEFWLAGFPFKFVQHTRVGIANTWLSLASPEVSMLRGPSVPLFADSAGAIRIYLIPAAANVLAVALVFFAAAAALAKAKERVRIRAGRCSSCGYPSDPAASRCPECGTAPAG